MKRAVTTSPVLLPVDVAEVKERLVIEHNDDEPLLYSLITEATDWAEHYTQRRFMRQTVTYYFDHFDDCLQLQETNIVNAVVNYNDTDGISQTLPDTNYYLDSVIYPARLTPITNWPVTADKPNAITIVVTVGYDDALAVPAGIKTGILLLVGHLYEHRSSVITGTITAEMPLSAKSFLQPYRLSL